MAFFQEQNTTKSIVTNTFGFWGIMSCCLVQASFSLLDSLVFVMKQNEKALHMPMLGRLW